MACLSFSSMSMSMHRAVALPFAALTNNPSPQEKEIKPNPTPKTRTRQRRRRRRLPQQKPQSPSISQIERAIGAGSFRDTDSSDLEEHRRKTIFDGLLPITAGKFEGEIEKKLRETGEFIGSRTEAAFHSSGKRILLFVLQWFLPVWTFSLLVASGVIKLPFSTPLIDDLIM